MLEDDINKFYDVIKIDYGIQKSTLKGIIKDKDIKYLDEKNKIRLKDMLDYIGLGINYGSMAISEYNGVLVSEHKMIEQKAFTGLRQKMGLSMSDRYDVWFYKYLKMKYPGAFKTRLKR